MLAKCAATTLSSKLIGGEKEFFATMVVDAVMAIGNDDRLNLIGIKKVKKYICVLLYKSAVFLSFFSILGIFNLALHSMSKFMLCSVYRAPSILPIVGFLDGFCKIQ